MAAYSVSIIIPSYNRSTIVCRAVKSALSQSAPDCEVIIVDDGSTDDTAKVLAGLADERISIFRHDRNCGAQAARNTGARAARGEWLCFLDSDDTLLPASVELRLKEGKRGSFPVVHSAGWKLTNGHREMIGLISAAGYVYDDVLLRPGPMYQGMLIKSEAFHAIGGLDPDIIAFQEWDTAIRLAKEFRFGYCSEPTFIYDCTRTDTISKNLIRSARGYDQVFKKHRSEIRRLGRKAMSAHYRTAAMEYLAAGDKHTARLRLANAVFWWPGPRTCRAFLTDFNGLSR